MKGVLQSAEGKSVGITEGRWRSMIDRHMPRTRRGTMVISLDFELSWGRFDHADLSYLEAEAVVERKQIQRLLALMDEYEIPSTWAVVGHLMLDECRRSPDQIVHPEITPHARYSWFAHDWYAYDPCTNADAAPAWYAPDVLDWIRKARVRHEIGSHSFGHICYGDPECTASMAQADLQAALAVAETRGVVLESFVFPRNQVGHLDVLRRSGLGAYRGADPPHIAARVPGPIRKVITVLDHVLGFPPRSVRAEEVLPGLWNIPGNHFYLPREGAFRWVPIGSRVLKAKRGIRRAIKQGGLYHLWFHPFNLNADPDMILSGLEEIFAYANIQRERGFLDVLTMGDYARRLKGEAIPIA